MFWSVVTVIVAELIIIAFLIPVFAAIFFGEEIAHSISEARHERMKSSVRRVLPSSMKTSGPFCPWEPHRAH